MRDFVKNAATLWEGNWAQAEEALSSKQRVSAMRDEAQREQGDSVLDAMQQRHAQVTLALTLSPHQVRDFVKNAATLWEGNWAQAEEALSSKQRVSDMRSEARREQP